MARGTVFVFIDGHVSSWRTDLTGHGRVLIGETFTIRQVYQFGNGSLVKPGRTLKVTAVSVGTSPLYAVEVDVLSDSRCREAKPTTTRDMFADVRSEEEARCHVDWQ